VYTLDIFIFFVGISGHVEKKFLSSTLLIAPLNCINIIILHRIQEVGENGNELKERRTEASIRLDAQARTNIYGLRN
jgi:hypothetical protein